MDKLQNNVPRVRFKEFNQSWISHSLDKITIRLDSQRKPVSEEKRISGNTPYYGANGIQSFVEGHTHAGDFILIAEDGANDLNNYPILHVSGKIWVNNHAHVLCAIDKISDTKFLSSNLKTLNFKPYLVGGGRAKLNANTMMNIEINIPSIEEQTQIGNFFQKLDKLIELSQTRLEQAKTYKKAMLQKMFPQQGETVPQIRFKGFSGDWDKGVLAEAVDNEKKGTAKFNELKEGTIEYLDAERLNGGLPSKVRAKPDVDIEDILILWDGSNAGSVYTGFSGVLGSTLKAYKINSDYKSSFLYQYLVKEQSLIFNSYRTPNIPHVIKDFINVFSLLFPRPREQQLIGNFFQKLDQNIEKHKSKLEQYQQLKKAMLQRMFV